MKAVLSVVFILSTYSKTFCTNNTDLIKLSELPNGRALMNEYIISDPDDICVGRMNDGLVTLDQYHAAMQIRSYKYLYLLTEYNFLTILKQQPMEIITFTRTAMETIISYMKKCEVPIDRLEAELPKFVHFTETKYATQFGIDDLLSEFKNTLNRSIVAAHVELMEKEMPGGDDGQEGINRDVMSREAMVQEKLDKAIEDYSFFRSVINESIEAHVPPSYDFDSDLNEIVVHNIAQNISNEYEYFKIRRGTRYA